jgi:hypothetical protein
MNCLVLKAKLDPQKFYMVKIRFRRQSVALVDFCAISNARIPIAGAALQTKGLPGVCGVKIA